jgi:hypothetical protein
MIVNGIGSKPIFLTEGNWAPSNNSTFTDDQKIAYLGQEYLLIWGSGTQVARYYWYAYDNTSGFGPLSISGTITPAGTAYGLLYNWLVGSTHVSNNCGIDSNGTTLCTLTRSGQPAQIYFNPTTTVSEPVSSTYVHYLTLDNATVNSISGGAVSVGAKPIMVTP